VRRWASVALIVLLVGACSGGDDGGQAEGGGSPTTLASGEADPSAVVLYVADGSSLLRVEPGSDGTELLGGLTDAYEAWANDGSVWVAEGAGRLVQVDPDSGDVGLDIQTGDFVEDIDVGEGALWVLSGIVGVSTKILKVDLDSGEILATVEPETGAFFEDVAVGSGAVWAVGGDPLSLSIVARIDPATAAVTDLIDVGMGPDRVAAGYDSVWAVGGRFLNSDGSGDQGMDLVRIDPSTNQVVERLDVGDVDGYPDLAAGYDSVWLTDTPAGELVRVDSTGTEVVARVGVGSGGQDSYEIDLAKGLVWVGNPFENRIYAVDPSTNDHDTGVEGGTKGVAFEP
jgi:hypothetical protein